MEAAAISYGVADGHGGPCMRDKVKVKEFATNLAAFEEVLEPNFRPVEAFGSFLLLPHVSQNLEEKLSQQMSKPTQELADAQIHRTIRTLFILLFYLFQLIAISSLSLAGAIVRLLAGEY